MNANPKRVKIAFELTEDEAWHLAQFLKRQMFDDFQSKASRGDEEAYAMRDSAERVRDALAEAGYAPR